MDKKGMNIESYDGNDAFYSGTDEEYQQFLKDADVKIDADDVEPVANTQRINLNETINIQGVIDKFRKTAGGIESGAKKFKDSFVNKMDSLKTKKETENEQEAEGNAAETKQTSDTDNTVSSVSVDLSKLYDKLDALGARLNSIEQTGLANKSEQLTAVGGVSSEIRAMSADVAEIKQAVTSVVRLNDSVFDLKNTQLNAKNAISDLETSVKRLKKKCILGVTVLSILSAIVIGLEIILMLS